MAYTYEQFESAARKAGMLDKFEKQDLVIAQSNPEYGISMLQLMKNRNGATTSEQKILADEAARQLRQTYGGYVSGGRLPEYADEVIQQTDNYYAGQSAYRRQLAEAEGYGSHAYDEKLGDIYSRQNDLERERARADALATASARTGGVPSSYALMLAQQAGNESDAQLDAAILGLRQNAYQEALAKAAKPIVSGGAQSTPGKKPIESNEGDDVKTSPGAFIGNAVNQVTNAISGKDAVIGRPNQDKPGTSGGGVFSTIGNMANKVGNAVDGFVSGLKDPGRTGKTLAFKKQLDEELAQWKYRNNLSAENAASIITSYLNNIELTDAEYRWLATQYGLI